MYALKISATLTEQ